MTMTKLRDNIIALVKLEVSYSLYDEEVEIESTFTPFEFNSKIEFIDQYDFIGMALDMIDHDYESLGYEDREAFESTLDIKVLFDDRHIINLN